VRVRLGMGVEKETKLQDGIYSFAVKNIDEDQGVLLLMRDNGSNRNVSIRIESLANCPRESACTHTQTPGQSCCCSWVPQRADAFVRCDGLFCM